MSLNSHTLHSKVLSKTLKRGVVIPLTTIVVLVALLLVGCSASNQAVAIPPQGSSVPTASGLATTATLYDENAVVSLYQRIIPAVVKIETVLDAGASIPNLFGLPTPRQQKGQGSGFFIDSEGHILTNNHVVEGATKVTITLQNGKTSEAKVIGTDRQNDLALLQVSNAGNDKITFLSLGNSDVLVPGQMAIALGSPYGLQGSITVGVVSGVGRSLPSDTKRVITNVIQTDAAINPGNSGGPLLNSRGEVIGINTAIEVQANSIGFAVPINTAKTLLPALTKGGQIKSPWLGIEGLAINRDLASKLSLPVENGVYIVGVTAGSPAEKAGLIGSGSNQQEQPPVGGDIITGVDNVTVNRVEDIVSYFNGKQPGDTVSLSIYRGDKKLAVSIVLGEWPAQAASSGK